MAGSHVTKRWDVSPNRSRGAQQPEIGAFRAAVLFPGCAGVSSHGLGAKCRFPRENPLFASKLVVPAMHATTEAAVRATERLAGYLDELEREMRKARAREGPKITYA